MTTAIAIKIPALPTAIAIPSEWLATRDTYAAELSAIVVADNCGFQAATELYNRAKKHSAALEKTRKALTDPFNDAAKQIKAAADNARAPLDAAIERVNAKIVAYATAERERERKEREAAEQAAREEAARRVAEQEAEAEVFGDAAEPPPPVEVAPVFVERRAVSANVRIGERLAFQVVDADAVPRAFCMVDERAIRAHMNAQADELKAKLRDDPAYSPIPGVRLTIETSLATR